MTANLIKRIAAFGLAILLGTLVVHGQENEIVSSGVAAAGDGLGIDALKKRLDEIAADEALDPAVQKGLKEAYEAALASLEARDADQAQEQAYRSAVENASEDLARMEQETQELSKEVSAENLVSKEERGLDPAEFKTLLVSEETRLAGLRKEAADLEAEISNEKIRAEQIREEVPAAGQAVQDATTKLSQLGKVEAGTLQEGEQVRAKARKEAGEAAVSKLKQEQVSSGQRMKLLQAKLALTQAQVDRAQARVGELEKVQAARLEDQVAKATKEAEDARKRGGVLAERAEEVAALSDDLKVLAGRLQEVTAEEDAAEKILAELQREKQLVERQLEIGGGRGAFAQVLMEQQQALSGAGDFRRNLSQRQAEITEVRFAVFQVEKKLRQQVELEQAAAKLPEESREKAQELLETRKTLLQQLEEEYQRLTRKLGQLDLVERQTFAEVREFRAVLEEALFWVPSSPRLGPETFKTVPEATSWLLAPGRLTELGYALGRVVKNSPARIAFLVLLLLAFTALRSRFRRGIASHRVEIRRISTDRYSFSVQALAMVALMSVPLPLLLWAFGHDLLLEESKWVQGMGLFLEQVAPLVFVLVFIRELCRNNGMGDVHFGWTQPRRERVRRDLILIALVYYPALWIVVTLLLEDSARMVHGLGRLAYMVAMIWMAVCVSHLVRLRDGIFSGLISQHPGGALSRFRYVWYVVLVGMPLVLAGLAAMGYLFTAFELTIRFAGTLGIVGLSYLLYWMLLRWFLIRERRMALAQLQKARQARREAAAKEAADPGVAGEEGSIVEIAEEEVDLVAVGAQTRHLLRLLVFCVALVGIWLVWAEAMPVLRYLDTEPFLGRATVADLLLGGVIALATVVLAKNLPGILELTVLGNFVEDSGSRYAIATLVQYVILTVGFLAFFEAVGMDWSQFGWMAAALGVGLGFGLQEIVANFVSGIILLFERPIRVGDVVTIGDTTGVVSRIRIRATTITDWDRKEYVVPNKEFVTGRLLNWTLTNKVNRVVIKVGVAYGSDVQKVRDLLTEIVGGHPAIMDDPAPGVTFENFGDSSLDFTVRCYLPDLDRRLATIHELNGEIHDRFAKEGIEIPFPQRDLHVRSGWGGEG